MTLASGLLLLVFGVLLAGRTQWLLWFWHWRWERTLAAVVVPGSLALGASLLALSVVSLLHRDVLPPEPTSPNVDLSRIVTTLEERMPTNDVLERRHFELLDVLRSSRPTVSTVATAQIPRRIKIGYILFEIGLITCVVASLSIFFGSGKLITPLKLLRVGTMFSVGALFSLGGFSLIKDFNLQVTLPGGPGISPSGEVVGVIQHGSVGPFVTGQHALLETGGQESVNAVTKSIRESEANHELLVLFVVGNADKRPLTGRRAMVYGSNVGLAQARSEWFRIQMVSFTTLALPPDRVVAIVRGPSKTGPVVPFPELADDRQVSVYGLWTLKGFPPPKDRR